MDSLLREKDSIEEFCFMEFIIFRNLKIYFIHERYSVHVKSKNISSSIQRFSFPNLPLIVFSICFIHNFSLSSYFFSSILFILSSFSSAVGFLLKSALYISNSIFWLWSNYFCSRFYWRKIISCDSDFFRISAILMIVES